METNKTKVCCSCGDPKPIGDFATRRGEQKQSSCKMCSSKYSRQHYEENKKAYIAKVGERRTMLQQWVNSLKEGKACTDCGIRYKPHQMDFDHREGKIKGIAEFIHDGCSKDQILAEVSKCDLVCSNCHRDRTFNRSKVAEGGVEPPTHRFSVYCSTN